MASLAEAYSLLSAPSSFPQGVSVEEEDIWMERSELTSQLAGMVSSAQAGGWPDPIVLRNIENRLRELHLPRESPEWIAIAALNPKVVLPPELRQSP